MTNAPAPALRLDDLLRSVTWTKAVIAVGLLIAAIVVGRYVGHHLPALEQWITGHGALGWAVFVGLMVIGTSVFVPDSVFAVLAGVLFGVVLGAVLITIGALLTAIVNFQLSRHFFHHSVREWLSRQPRLAAVERAVNREGLRFQFLLRLTPLSPVAVNYTLGVTNTSFPVYLAACVGLIPGLLTEVYFGNLAKHVARLADDPAVHHHSNLWPSAIGLLVCVGLMIYTTKIAKRAISQSESDQ